MTPDNGLTEAQEAMVSDCVNIVNELSKDLKKANHPWSECLGIYPMVEGAAFASANGL